MADDLERIERARLDAWIGRPLAEIDQYWDQGRREFVFPDGWPEGEYDNGLDPAEPGRTWLHAMLE